MFASVCHLAAAAALGATTLGGPVGARAAHEFVTVERPGATEVFARGLNHHGQAIAVERRPTSLGPVGFVWSEHGGAVDLALPPRAEASYPRAIDDEGRVFGAAGPALAGAAAAVYWPHPDLPIPMDRVGGRGAREWAVGLDAEHRVVGNVVTPSSESAVAWDQGGDLARPPLGDHGVLSRARVVDARGLVWGERVDLGGQAAVVHASPDDVTPVVRAPGNVELLAAADAGDLAGLLYDEHWRPAPFYMPPGGEPEIIDVPAAGAPRPRGVTARGLVALEVRTDAAARRFFLWAPRLGLRPLEPLLPSRPGERLRIEHLGGLNERGELLLSGAVARGNTETPALFLLRLCPGDFNLDGRRNSADAAEYLAAFRTGDRLANLHHPEDSPVDVLDLIAFLRAWKNGC